MAELGVQSCTLQGRLLGSSLKEVDRGRLGGDTPPHPLLLNTVSLVV